MYVALVMNSHDHAAVHNCMIYSHRLLYIPGTIWIYKKGCYIDWSWGYSWWHRPRKWVRGILIPNFGTCSIF